MFAVLQIVSVSGTLFALNSSLLLLYRELARRGQVTRIRAERVSVDKIPATLLSRPRHPRTRSAPDMEQCLTRQPSTLHVHTLKPS